MISSAALPVPVHLPSGGGAAEAPTSDSKKPRPVQQHRNGASKTVLSTTSLKEATTYEQSAYQQRRHRHRPDVLDVGQEGQGPAGAREGREEVTAPVPAPNMLAFELDLAAVFTAHGFDPHTVQISAAPMLHGDHLAGVTVSAFSYVRPEGVPAPRPEPHTDPLAAAAETVEAVS